MSLSCTWRPTGAPETLASFLARALVTYGPGVHKAIGFWDHGSGVFDEGDPDETVLERRAMRTPRHLRARSFRERRLFLSRYRNSMDPGSRLREHSLNIRHLQGRAMLARHSS